MEERVDNHDAPELDFDGWMRIGLSRGWCGPPVCYTHDGVPSTAQEDDEWIEGKDPCMHIVRLYEDAQMRALVEMNHSPSKWRNTYER
ncbi:MAG: hypothetical protein EBU84_01755 [Actinobacteria bacterium]|nr:hypothetical protein [Actinomycetota bacterium]